MRIQMHTAAGTHRRLVLQATPEEIAGVAAIGDHDVVVVERDAYLEALRPRTTELWDAVADSLDGALRAVVEPPAGASVTWWMPVGRLRPVYILSDADGTLPLVGHADPGKAFAAILAHLAH